jgi:hypothetical protein
MKRILLLGGLLFNLSAQAQLSIPNAGFEEGDAMTVKDWKLENSVVRSNSYTGTIGGQEVTIHPHGGQYFLQLTTHVNGSTVKIAKATTEVGNVGYPDSFAFNAVYFSKIEWDNFVVQIDFLKYDAGTHTSSSVYSTSTSQVNTGKTWKRVSNRIFYFGDPPVYDSLRISILATNTSQHDPQTNEAKFADGTTVLLDDFTLISNSSGIGEKQTANTASVYPNPSAGNFTFTLTRAIATPATVQVYDVQGHCVLSRYVAAGTQNILIEAADWKPGTYLYRITGSGFADHGRLVRLP